MNIRSYYINIRRRWGLSPDAWNKFFMNLKLDYMDMKDNIDDHPINDIEGDLMQNKIYEFILDKERRDA